MTCFPYGRMSLTTGLKIFSFKSARSSRFDELTCSADFPIHKVAHHLYVEYAKSPLPIGESCADELGSDGVFISNGPGDPTHCADTVYHVRPVPLLKHAGSDPQLTHVWNSCVN